MPQQAQAVPNPYKIQPIVASDIPAGSTYTRPIIVYNPRDSSKLAITEARKKGFCVLGCLVLPGGGGGGIRMERPRVKITPQVLDSDMEGFKEGALCRFFT